MQKAAFFLFLFYTNDNEKDTEILNNYPQGVCMEKPMITRKGKTTSISFFTLDNRTEETVRNEIEEIFRESHHQDWRGVIYTCVKELMVNASKANIKKTFFIEARISEADRPLYEEAKVKVRKLMNDNYFYYLRQKLQKHSHNVEVTFQDRGKGVVISVKNPTPLLPDEEANVRYMLKQAMENEDADLSLFYNDSSEHSGEGASLGLILIINLLRQMGINPATFRVGMIDNGTIARLEIPVADGYRPLRK